MDQAKVNEDSRSSPHPEGQPDIMNDPAYDTFVKHKRKNTDEADTCRICRGEGSKDEPLFYPCKCSGSIKFVHQNCLMEWLSHSQKKHCELCKTPFRFTKLYHQDMPSTVPLPIFLRQAAVHTWKSFLTWSRFHLVLFVWAAWLPWCMRTIWRGLFWIGDGGWVNWNERRLQNETVRAKLPADPSALGTSPANHTLYMSNEAFVSAFVSQISNNLPRLLSPVRQLFTLTRSEPLGLRLSRRILQYVIGGTPNTTLSATTAANVTNHSGSIPRSSSWLSDFQFLRTLTRSTMVNNIVIDTLEGQLITLLVVVAFILVFLIREWVVQQQPNLNGGAELNVAIAAGQNAEIAVPEEPADQRREAPEGDGDAMPRNEGALAQAPRARMIARARQRRPRPQRQAPDQSVNQGAEATRGPETIDLDQGPSDAPTQMPPQNDPSDDPTSWSLYASSSQRLATEVRDTPDDLTSGALSANSTQRPSMPERDTVARVAEIRRTIEEQSRLLRIQGSPIEVAEVFNELWNRSENEPMEVIRMVEEQGRGAELQGLILAMRELEDERHVEGRQETTRPQDDLDASSVVNQEDDPNHIRRSQSDDEEGFVLLDKPLTPSPEAEAERSANMEGTMTPNDETAFYIATPTSSIDIETGASQPTTPPNTVVRDSSGHRSRSSTIEQEVVESEVVHVTSVDADTPTFVTDSSHDNPFHPDFAGDLPESSALVNVAASDDNSSNSRLASQTRGSHMDLSNMRAQESFADEKSDQPLTFIEIVEDWLWGGVTLPPAPPVQAAGDDEHIVHDEAAEEPFVRVEHGQHARPPANDGGIAGQDAEVVAAAIQAGLDPNEVDAVDDIEDLEGILELVGMQGPLAGLVQNGMFCAVLVSLTIFFGVWIPYISGKAFLIILTHPVSLLLKLPLRWAASSADMIVDFFTFTIGCAFYWVDTIVSLLCTPVAWMIPALARISQNKLLAGTAKAYAESALERLAKDFITTGNIIAGSDIPTFSLVAHESLRWLEACASWLLRITGRYCVHYFNLVYDNPGLPESVKLLAIDVADGLKILGTLVTEYAGAMVVLAPTLVHINPLRVNLSIPQRTTPLDYELAHWDTKDRTWAIIFGYLLFAVLGVIYLDLSARIRGTNKAGRVEGGIADCLYQAGGVTKVVLIIGIEMIVFPLYCGLLLDVALLPLFGNATLMSRITFTMSSPNTSIFVHWFVGTCYMFHFALFVSMCRKILRTGVLYFIRDPDDPTFHPVRDVLERSVSTQLWKISFSALVYGGLVIVCLGGVVWGISYAFNGVLPIHWSSNEPVLEFPVDLLFYNFLMPLAVKFFKPSKGLNKMYSWWFRKCARALRLTNFLFGERQKDEEGTHLRRTWTTFVNRLQNDTQKPSVGEIVKDDQAQAQGQSSETSFVRNGKYVRAPASDQVRIPKGAHTFLEVNEDNQRIDGEPDSDEGLHGNNNDMFTKVYIPPFFRLRISVFIFLIWLFAASTGVSATIVPLILGRFIFANLAPPHLHINDIYAFSIGLYILGGVVYGVFYHQSIIKYVRETVTPHAPTVTSYLRKSATLLNRLLSLIYTYAAFGIFIPALLSLLMEFYLIIPLHTYLSTTYTALDSMPPERHIIHLIQDWTLGVLYLKMAARLILYNAPSRPAAALRGIVRNGWLNPDVRLATRGFILPATVCIGVALTLPLGLGWLASNTILRSQSGNNEVFESYGYRYSYPGVLAVGCVASFLILLGKAFKGWRKRVRDEVYLIGERLHNFGDSKRRGNKGKRRESRREQAARVWA